jgi:septal ring factor EnvC (AmiA/AmiB activator)
MKAWRLVFASGLATLALFTTVPKAADDEIEARQKELSDVEQRMRGLAQDLQARRSDRGTLLAELEKLERNIADLALSGRQLEAMVAEEKRALADLDARLATERRALESEQAMLAQLLRSAYAAGRGDRIRLLLNQQDAAKVSRVMAYYGYLNRYRMTRIAEIDARARKLEQLARESEEEGERLAALAARQSETRERLTARRGERQELLTALEKTIATDEARFSGLKADAEGLRQLLDQLERRAQALPEADLKQEAISKRRGMLAWPLADGHLVYHFGQSKGSSGQRWDGVVIAGREGAEVRAVYGGRVVYADWLRGFGLLLIIEHDDGYMSLYGYNQTLLKEPGEWVAAGDVIALSGSSGGRRSPGLYFAIRHHGHPVNPEKWCRAGGKMSGRRVLRSSALIAERAADSPIEQDIAASGPEIRPARVIRFALGFSFFRGPVTPAEGRRESIHVGSTAASLLPTPPAGATRPLA